MSVADLNQLILSAGCFSGASIGGWTVDPAVIAPLVGGLLLYAVGLMRLWRSAGVGRGSSLLQFGLFLVGWLCMAAALVTPLHAISRRFFAANMVEHELVMPVAAPM